MTYKNRSHNIITLLALLSLLQACASLGTGTLKGGRYYTPDNLLSIVPPPIDALEIKGGSDKAVDRMTGYRSYIGWADFSSKTASSSAVGLYSIEWMNIGPGPIKDDDDFYSRATWYLDNYLRIEYYMRFQGAFDGKEIFRERIRVNGYPALRVILHGPIDKKDFTAGVITIVGIKDIIVNAQVSFGLPEQERGKFRETHPWKHYVTMVESIRPRKRT